MNKSLGDYLVDRTESLDNKSIIKYFIERNDDKIARLLDKEQYLLEGSRGVGKTMLMKTAMLQSLEKFGQNSILPVWISFEESIRLERISIVKNSIDPFLQWTMGKILAETLNIILKIKPEANKQLDNKLSKIFGTEEIHKDEKYSDLLNSYIKLLEKADIKDSSELEDKTPSQNLMNVLDNPYTFKEFLLTLIKDFNLSRIVFLFDEAAHVFSYAQQEKFFTFFKALRDPKIACKAAVYPGITNYGKSFERGQDAKELRINWNASKKDDLEYIKKILKKRIQGYSPVYWQQLTANTDIIDMICICSNGNPRFAFHIIDEIDFNKKITNQSLINTIRSVFKTKWTEFSTLRKRLIKYETHIYEAEKLIKETIIPNLLLWNDKQRKANKKLSGGINISTDVYDKLHKLFAILDYSNLININHSKKALGHKRYGYYVSLNPSLLFTDIIIKDINEFNLISISNDLNQEYTTKTSGIVELIKNLKESDELVCSNSICDFKTTDDEINFCSRCGHPIKKNESESLYKILRSHDINYLKLSKKIKTRLATKFHNIGEIYDAEPNDIRMHYIQDVRIEKIKNASIEYMAG